MSFTHYCPPEGVVPKSHSEVIRFTQGHTALGMFTSYLYQLLYFYLENVSKSDFYRRQRSCGKLMFSQACQEFCRRGWGVVHATSPAMHAPSCRTCSPQACMPPGACAHTPQHTCPPGMHSPLRHACLPSGRY